MTAVRSWTAVDELQFLDCSHPCPESEVGLHPLRILKCFNFKYYDDKSVLGDDFRQVSTEATLDGYCFTDWSYFEHRLMIKLLMNLDRTAI